MTAVVKNVVAFDLIMTCVIILGLVVTPLALPLVKDRIDAVTTVLAIIGIALGWVVVGIGISGLIWGAW